MESPSTGNSSSAPSSSHDLPSGLKFFVANLKSLVPIKLDATNYLLWKAQLTTVLDANDLLKFIVSPPPPSPLTPVSTVLTGDIIAPPLSVTYESWKALDPHLRSCLFATITPTVLPSVLHLHSAHDIWKSLEARFTSQSRSHVHQLKSQLWTLSKGSQSMSSYLDSIKLIIDQLSQVNEYISDEDLILYVMRGLPREFDYFKSNIRTRATPISLAEFQNLLLNEDLHITPSSPIHETTEFFSAMHLHRTPRHSNSRFNSSNSSPRGPYSSNNSSILGSPRPPASNHINFGSNNRSNTLPAY